MAVSAVARTAQGKEMKNTNTANQTHLALQYARVAVKNLHHTHGKFQMEDVAGVKNILRKHWMKEPYKY